MPITPSNSGIKYSGSLAAPNVTHCLLAAQRESTETNTCFAQRPRYRCGNLRRAGSVAVDAESLRINGNLAPVARNHYPSLRDAKCLPRCFLGIADECIPKLARAQSSIRFIPPISERFGSNCEPRFPKDIQHRRTRQSNQHDIAAPSRDAFRNRFRKLAIAHRLIVKRAVRLDVYQARSASGRHISERLHLIE